VVPQDITPALAQSFGLANENGALVGDVKPGTPAEKAGIKDGDVITEFNGEKISGQNDLLLAVSDCPPDVEATVQFTRDGKEHTVKVTLAERPDETAAQTTEDSNKTDALDGVTVSDLDSDARQQLQIPDEVKGAIVTDISQDSHAADAGLHKGDVIVSIDHHPVASADEAIKICNAAKGKNILLKVWTQEGGTGGTHYLSVDNTKEPQQ
jgi:serine protease Do